MTHLRCGIMTVSDRSYRGERADGSGPILVDRILQLEWQVSATVVVPDEADKISQQLAAWSDQGMIDLILTTGGTGFAPRDVTPEATTAVLEKLTPGIAEAMRLASLQKTPHAMLSRSVAGIRKQTLIINLPGSPKAALENFEVVIPVIPHAIELLQESSTSEKNHQFNQSRGV